jgi:DNA repair protein RadD
VDCVLWLRPTQSPVLYVQGAGRGTRIADGKADCLWLDFSDTTERLGPVDAIRGRKKRAKTDQDAPYALCENCGARVRPASALVCPECGAQLREPEAEPPREVSNAPILAHQARPKINTYPVTRVEYAIHNKPGKPDSLRVEYYSGLRRVAQEWICFEHGGFARAKAEAWWGRRSADDVPRTTDEALSRVDSLAEPSAITVNESGQYPEIIGYQWSEHEPIGIPGSSELLPARA